MTTAEQSKAGRQQEKEGEGGREAKRTARATARHTQAAGGNTSANTQTYRSINVLIWIVPVCKKFTFLFQGVRRQPQPTFQIYGIF